jgi:ABC-type enterobactin transport system permease subunit
MLVIQGVGINSVFIYVRQYLMKGNTFTCNMSIQKYFPGYINLLTFKTTIPHHLTLIVFFKVLLQNIDTLSSLSPLKPSTLFIPTLKLSQSSRGHIPIFPVQEE